MSRSSNNGHSRDQEDGELQQKDMTLFDQIVVELKKNRAKIDRIRTLACIRIWRYEGQIIIDIRKYPDNTEADMKEIPIDFQTGFVYRKPAESIPQPWKEPEDAEKRDGTLARVRMSVLKLRELTINQIAAFLLWFCGCSERMGASIMKVDKSTYREYLKGRKNRRGKGAFARLDINPHKVVSPAHKRPMGKRYLSIVPEDVPTKGNY